MKFGDLDLSVLSIEELAELKKRAEIMIAILAVEPFEEV